MEQFVPHTYQQDAIAFLNEHPAAALFLDMGLGKSVITLTAIHAWIYDEARDYKVLIVAPRLVAESTWTAEAAKWEHLKHLRIVQVSGDENRRIRKLKEKADIYTISRDSIVWLVKYYKKRFPFNVVVIDESSGFKSHTAQRFRALKSVRPYIERMIELTGTPSPNGLLDLWSQLYLLDGGARLGKTYTQYRDTFFQPDQRDCMRVFSWKVRDSAEEEIYRRISDICMSMKAKDYLQLPELVEHTIEAKLSASETERYKSFERDWLLEFDTTSVTAASAAVLAGKLLQLANGAIYTEGGGYEVLSDAKIEALRKLTETRDRPILVFYSYRHDLERLKAAFPNASEYRGNTEYEAWNRGEIPLLLCHPASIGYGLNLQAGGNVIVWFGLPWSLELYLQSIARLHRQGQRNTVEVYYLIAKGCYDENILPALRRKELTQDKLLSALKRRAKEYQSRLKEGIKRRGINDKV